MGTKPWVTVAVHRWWKAYTECARHALPRHPLPFRSHAGLSLTVGIIVLLAEAVARHNKPYARGNDQGAVGAGKIHRPKASMTTPVCFGISLEFEKIVVESGVNHALRAARTTPHAVGLRYFPRCTWAPAAISSFAPHLSGPGPAPGASANNSCTMAEPIKPVAPVTKTRISFIFLNYLIGQRLRNTKQTGVTGSTVYNQIYC